MGRIVLVLSGVGFLIFGVKALFDPVGLWTSFGLVVSDEPAVRTELRAFYGGLEIALGALLLAFLTTPDRQRTGLLIAAVIYAGLGLGRLVGIVVDGEVARIHWIALAIELGLAALSMVALWRMRPDR